MKNKESARMNLETQYDCTKGDPRFKNCTIVSSDFCFRNHNTEIFTFRISNSSKCSWKFFLVVYLLSSVVYSAASFLDGSFPPINNTSSSEGDANVSSVTTSHNHHHHLHQNHHLQRRGSAEHQQQIIQSDNLSSQDHSVETTGSRSVAALDEHPQPFTINESNLSKGFWIRVAQAKAMAISVENGTLPKLDDLSHIMKPAACGHDQDDSKCKNFIARCAEDEAGRLIYSPNPSMNQVPQYVETIWQKCGLPIDRLWNSRWKDPHSIFAPSELAKPIPMFHCNSHVGKKDDELNFVTNFRMEYPHTIGPPPGVSKDAIPRFFVIEMEHGGEWNLQSVQPFWLFRFNTKVHGTYRIRVTAVSPKYVFPPVTSPPVTLYDSSVQTIGKPVNLRVVNITVDNGAARPSPSALLRWNSGSGFNASCDFDVFYMDEDYTKVERKKGDDAFWVKLDSLHFERNYSVKVIERFGGKRESDVLEQHLYIPSCVELRGYSFDLCPPPPPSKVRLVNATATSFWLVWKPPKYVNATNSILHYNLVVDWISPPSSDDAHSAFNAHKVFSGTVPGNTTMVEIKNVTNVRGKFKVSVAAVSTSGPSQASLNIVFFEEPALNTWTVRKVLMLFFTLIGIVGLVGFFCLLKNFHERRQRKKKRQEKFENYEKESLQLPQIFNDATKWEIDCCSLMLGDAIGQGHFGLVRRATLTRRGRKMIVAVKTLRDGIGEKDVEKFWEEFEILKNLDPHIHVVGLKGIVTKHVERPLLVVEYCDGGDLQTHLRKAFHFPNFNRLYSPSSSFNSTGFPSVPPNTESSGLVQTRVVTNEAYFIKNEEETPTVTKNNLLSYARQIACGMEYLSSNKIIHRDLACRNILISGKTRVLKISDFGLSRDVYEQNWYKKSSNGEIPIKWLAIECLLNEVYTTKSDVWSYGITLWEIFTHGGNPYPGVENNKVFDLLKDGYRMPKPEHCPDDMYEVMRSCWEDEPCDRPDFTSIRLIVEDIIEKTTHVTYLNLEPALAAASCEDENNENAFPMLPPRRKPLSRYHSTGIPGASINCIKQIN